MDAARSLPPACAVYRIEDFRAVQVEPTYTPPPRVPDELLAADVPDWVLRVWLAVRKVQGSNLWAWASHAEYAEVAGKGKSQVTRAIGALLDAGWLEAGEGRKLRCHVGAARVEDPMKRLRRQGERPSGGDEGTPLPGDEGTPVGDERTPAPVMSVHRSGDEGTPPSESSQESDLLLPERGEAGRGARVPACELDWLRGVKVPLSEKERTRHAERAVAVYRLAARIGVRDAGWLYLETFGGGRKGLPGGQNHLAAALVRRYPWPWLVTAFVVTAGEGRPLSAVEGFIGAWLRDPAVAAHDPARAGLAARADALESPLGTGEGRRAPGPAEGYADAPKRQAQADYEAELAAMESGKPRG